MLDPCADLIFVVLEKFRALGRDAKPLEECGQKLSAADIVPANQCQCSGLGGRC